MATYGCKLNDRAPELFALLRPAAKPLPDAIDYRALFGPVDDQGAYQTCVAHASKALLDAVISKHTRAAVATSWRAIYALTKWQIESDDITDDGLAIEDALNALERFGYAPEASWSDADVTPANLLAPVPSDILSTVSTVGSFRRVAISPQTFMQALVAGGPLICGVTWPIEWEVGVSADGIMTADALTDAGGHCVLIIGYAHKAGQLFFRVRNSWGSTWGCQGYGWMPAAALGRVANAYACHIP